MSLCKLLAVVILLVSHSQALLAQTDRRAVDRYLDQRAKSKINPIEHVDRGLLPPGLKGVKFIKPSGKVKVTPLPDLLPPKAVKQARASTLADARVKQALGARHVFLGAWSPEPSKTRRRPSHPTNAILLQYYNYSTNQTFVFTLHGDRVVKLEKKPDGFLPAETKEEVDAAAAILISDKRFTRAVRGLVVRGIATPDGLPDRYIFLVFRKANGHRNIFTALINMSKQKVVRAGPR